MRYRSKELKEFKKISMSFKFYTTLKIKITNLFLPLVKKQRQKNDKIFK